MLRMPIDIAMTILSIVLMGGTVLFPDDRIHQILGMLLLALWICHAILNRRWYGSIFSGKQTPYRAMQIVVNLGLSFCALLLMVSGMMMAWFVPFDVGSALGFARTAHLISSHWYYVFMCAHLGMHVNVIRARIMQKKGGASSSSNGAKKIFAALCRLLLLFACLWGVWAFFARGLINYMFLRQQFFFFDFERGILLFAIDYICILIFIASAFHWLGKLLLFISKTPAKKTKK